MTNNKANKQEATARPWSANNAYGYIHRTDDSRYGNEPIAKFQSWDDAKFAVRAVNSYDGLLEAAKWALKNFDEVVRPVFDDQGRISSVENAAERLRGAIARAESR